VRIKANRVGLRLDPAFELSGVLCDLSITRPTVLFTPVLLACLEEGYGLRLYRAYTHCCCIKYSCFSKL